MREPQDIIDAAISEAEALRKLLKRKAARLVRAVEEQSIIKATSLTWFKNHQPPLVEMFGPDFFSEVDQLYKEVLAASHRQALRSNYISKLKDIKEHLVELGSQNVEKLTAGNPARQTSDKPPNFGRLISDPAMQAILRRRWEECIVCIDAGAPLAATVMMGGLLEALLLARIHRETNKAPIFTATSAPKDSKTGKTKLLNEWMLRNYIDVAHEMGWISQSAKDVGEVLRDYRNYIHPYKELSHGIRLETKDALVLWEVSKSISRQII